MINGDKQKSDNTSRVGKTVKGILGVLANKVVPPHVCKDPAPATLFLAIIAGFRLGRMLGK